MKILKLFLSTTLLTAIHAKGESMDELLNDYQEKSDLSQKTQIANAGNVRIFKRQELDNMQARTLKDVLNSLSLLNYAESRYGVSDPNYKIHHFPFSSNTIRIYVNDQEVSTASYGSGLFYFGDIELDFVDHIEVYTLNPSFEYSTEPAKFLIKLYSKTAERDSGAKFSSTIGSRGFTQNTLQHANTIEDVSYFTYLSHSNDNRKKYNSFGTNLSKDQERYFFLNQISNKEHALQIQAINNSKDTFFGLSPDGLTQRAHINSRYLHVGYTNNSLENFKLSTVYEIGTIENDYKDNYNELIYEVNDKILTIDAQYKEHTSTKNELIIGSKYRHKSFVVPSLFYNTQVPSPDYTRQEILTAYIEDHYALSKQWLFSFGAQIGKVKNNFIVKDQDIWMSRLGLVYGSDAWISKTFLHRSSFFIEPYLFVDTMRFTDQSKIKPERVSNITQEFEYTKEKHNLRTVIGYNYNEDSAVIKGQGLQNKPESESTLFTQLEHVYKHDIYNRLNTSFSYVNNRNININDISRKLYEYKGVVKLVNEYDKFTFFNQIIYNRNSLVKKNFLDYSTGIKYRYNDDLTFSLKGENIFNEGRKDFLERGRRNVVTGGWTHLQPLYVSPIDQSLYFKMEYFF